MEIIRRAAPRRKLDLTIPIEPVEFEPRPITKRICVFDSETDPFADGRIVKPFTCGFYLTDTGEYFDFWGDDCIDQFFAFLRNNYSDQELLIVAHNGGNFDFYFMLDHFDADHKPFIINGRLVRVMIGGQEFRDSYAMIPVALGTYDKLAIDYRCMERGFRDVFKETIREYQKRDCTSLGELVTAWYDRFGDKLTMASSALSVLRSKHGFETMSEKIDAEMRPFYFGGRNQCFTTGVLHGDFKVYDINSSYPNVMRKYKHPISDTPKYESKITKRSHFAYIRAWSLGALPIRRDDGGLDFPIGTFDFYACIHEIRAGLDTGTLRIIKVYHSIYFDAETDFADFIDVEWQLRAQAKREKDGVNDLFHKLVPNSSYGKFAQDPRDYENWYFDPVDIPTPFYCDACYQAIRKQQPRADCEPCKLGTHSPFGWYLHTERGGRQIYAQPQKVKPGGFFNVATAASITSAARADLLRGIQRATRPIYCDTDSIICEYLEPGEGIIIQNKDDEKILGAWDTEASGDTVCIAGKKLYAIFSQGEVIKKASKGVKLSADQIRRVCEGEVISYANPVPKFSLGAEPSFVTRNIRKTA